MCVKTATASYAMRCCGSGRASGAFCTLGKLLELSSVAHLPKTGHAPRNGKRVNFTETSLTTGIENAEQRGTGRWQSFLSQRDESWTLGNVWALCYLNMISAIHMQKDNFLITLLSLLRNSPPLKDDNKKIEAR